MCCRSSSSGLGLWVLRKLHQVPSSKGNNSCEGDCSPSLGPYRSVALPVKTRELGVPKITLIFDPEIKFVDSTVALKECSFPRLAVHDEPALRGVDDIIALITGRAH